MESDLPLTEGNKQTVKLAQKTMGELKISTWYVKKATTTNL